MTYNRRLTHGISCFLIYFPSCGGQGSLFQVLKNVMGDASVRYPVPKPFVAMAFLITSFHSIPILIRAVGLSCTAHENLMECRLGSICCENPLTLRLALLCVEGRCITIQVQRCDSDPHILVQESVWFSCCRVSECCMTVHYVKLCMHTSVASYQLYYQYGFK